MQPLGHYDPALLLPKRTVLVVRVATTQAQVYRMVLRYAINVAHNLLEVTSEATGADISGGSTQKTLHI
jgi:hypothetical protein